MQTGRLAGADFVLRIYDVVIDALAVAGAVIVVAIAGGIAADAILRNLPGAPRLEGVIELTEYGLYAVTVCAAPWALRKGAHITVEIVLDNLPIRARRRAEWLADFVGLGVSVLLVYAGGVAAWKSAAADRLVFKTFVFPEYWLLLPLPFAALLLATEFSLRLAGVRRRAAATYGPG